MRVLGGIFALFFILGFGFMLLGNHVTVLSGFSGILTGFYFLIFAISGETSLLKGLKAIGQKLS